MDLKFPAHVSSGARDLISKLLVKEPKRRLGLKEVCIQACSAKLHLSTLSPPGALIVLCGRCVRGHVRGLELISALVADTVIAFAGDAAPVDPDWAEVQGGLGPRERGCV